MSQESNTTRVTVDFPAMEHRRLKAVVALMGISMKDFIVGCVESELEKQLPRKPNKKTLEVFRHTDAGRNLKAYKDIEDLIEDLET